MKRTKSALAVLFLAVTGAAVAAPGSNADMPTVAVSASNYVGANSGDAYQGYTGFVSTKTRAQVQEEFRDAQRNGEIFAGEAYPGPLVAFSLKTRTRIVAELKDYRASGPLQR